MFAVLAEEFVRSISLGIEVLAAVVVGVGALSAFARALFLRRRGRGEHYEVIRIDLGRTLALGLELEIGADLLRVASAPSWSRIGILAAIIAVRSGLNYLLQHDIEHLQHSLETHETQADHMTDRKER